MAMGSAKTPCGLRCIVRRRTYRNGKASVVDRIERIVDRRPRFSQIVRCFPMVRVVTLELNELDFELVQQYVRDGHVPTFKRLLESHDLVRTIAETELS